MFRKPFLTYFVVCAVPLLLLAALNYWNGTRSVDATVNPIVQDDLHSFMAGINQLLDDQGNALLKLAVQPEIQRVASDPSLRPNAHARLKSAWDFGVFKSLALFDRDRRPLWFSTNTQQWEGLGRRLDSAVRAELPQPDDRVWTAEGNVLLYRPIDDSSSKPGVELLVPIHNESGLGNEGAVVGVVDLQRLLSMPGRGLEVNSGREPVSALIVVRDRSGNVLYQSDSSVAQVSGPTASAPMPHLNVKIAVTRSTDAFMWASRRWGIAGFVIALLFALLAAVLLDQYVRNRSRGIARVTEDLSAIARGEVDRRILLQSSDDARAIADNINS